MVTMLVLLAGCADPPLPNVIRGLQVIAIETVPAEPEPFEPLTLRVWVADGQGLGADVLLWVCTPLVMGEGAVELPSQQEIEAGAPLQLDGKVRCVEAHPPNSDGLPLSFWTLTGTTGPSTGELPGPPYFEATTEIWPLYVSIADASFNIPQQYRGMMLVWALACTPGTCSLIDDVKIDPKSDSEAWKATSDALADPVSWIEGLPRGQVSLAAKRVPVYLPDLEPDTTTDPYTGYTTTVTTPEPRGPNLAPSLTAGTLPTEEDRVVRLRVSDPDADPVQIRTFVTAGGAVATRQGDTGLGVLWHEPVDLRRPADLFVVAEDGRGGTAVWQWGSGGDGCAARELEPQLGTPNALMEPGYALPLVAVGTRLGFRVPWHVSGPRVPFGGELELFVDGERRASASIEGTAEGNLGSCQSSWGPTSLPMQMSDAQACALAGNLATVVFTVHQFDPYGTPVESTETSVQVVLTAGDQEACALPAP
jgi:hypothetical protein